MSLLALCFILPVLMLFVKSRLSLPLCLGVGVGGPLQGSVLPSGAHLPSLPPSYLLFISLLPAFCISPAVLSSQISNIALTCADRDLSPSHPPRDTHISFLGLLKVDKRA